MTETTLAPRELDELRFPLERGKLAELARALFDDDPVYRDPQAAAAAGFDGVPAPPTATVAIDHWAQRSMNDLAIELGLDLARVLHGSASWELRRPLRAGAELTARRRLADVTTKEGRRGGAMTLLTIETDFLDDSGEIAVQRRDTLIEVSA